MTGVTRAKRSDAALNRERILRAARTAFVDPDAEVSMAEIARRSGVGSGTLYRNFATRRELLEALYLDEVDAVCAAASTVEGDPGERFVAWLRRFFDYVTSKRLVAVELLAHADRTDSVFATSRERVEASAEPLLQAARESGQLETNLSLDQILDVIVAIAKISPDLDYVRPILDSTLAGLRWAPGGRV